MSKFKIFQDTPKKYKKEILSFWEEYLPGTPPKRLEWMNENPAGPVIWIFAVEEKTGKLAGTISLFPKQLFVNGKMVKAAILGDFMLHKKFRVFGPVLDLLKETITRQQRGEFDFLYTIPNQKAKKVAERVGFRPAGELYSLVCPQQCDILIEKYVGVLPAKILGKPASLLLNCFSRATYVSGSAVFEEINWNDVGLDKFCRKIRENKIGILTGDYSRSYLNWRYKQNPQFEFKIITCREQKGGDILGFFVFSFDKHRLELYDIMAIEDKFIPVMINKANKICKILGGRGIYVSIYENNPLLPFIKKCCFFDTKDLVNIYTYPEQIPEIGQWAFTSADRNI